MAVNRWLATGNFFTSYREEQRIFQTHLDRLANVALLAVAFAWPLFFEVGNKYMLVIDNILIAVIAVRGLNRLTGVAGLISIGHAAFVGVGAYTVASFSRVLGDSHVIITHAWPLVLLVAGGVGAVVGAFVGLPALRLKHLYLAIATLSFQMIFQWVINFMTFFNQGQTISVGRAVWLTGRVSREGHYLFWYYVILVIVVLFGFGVRNLLRTRYGLSPFEAAGLRSKAETLESEAPDTVRFTRAIKDAVPYEDRQGVVEALWEVVLADGAPPRVWKKPVDAFFSCIP